MSSWDFVKIVIKSSMRKVFYNDENEMFNGKRRWWYGEKFRIKMVGNQTMALIKQTFKNDERCQRLATQKWSLCYKDNENNSNENYSGSWNAFYIMVVSIQV